MAQAARSRENSSPMSHPGMAQAALGMYTACKRPGCPYMVWLTGPPYQPTFCCVGCGERGERHGQSVPVEDDAVHSDDCRRWTMGVTHCVSHLRVCESRLNAHATVFVPGLACAAPLGSLFPHLPHLTHGGPAPGSGNILSPQPRYRGVM